MATSSDVLAGAPWTALQAEPVDLDVAAAARTAAELVAPALARRGVVLEVRAPGPDRARLRPDALAQAFANLLLNAERYTPDGGRVAVAVRTAHVPGETVVVEAAVGNSGPGIPASALPRVFDRFYRVEQSRDRSLGGAGVGLAIVRQLVEADGGTVAATSRDGWTEFTVRYPAADAA